MGTIRVLPELMVNKIAAGEVIERPRSVVKELMENSLDARSGMISVSIRRGGKSLIKVMDNGAGMDREDAELCLKSHATSKISDPEDIFSINSLGFRGEALSSIAAVSRVTLRTRTSSEQVGTEVQVAGGNIESIKEKGTAVGTSLEISDLFFNTPARRKFLKGERAEYANIAEVVTTISLAHPQVAFKLHKDGELIFDYPSNSNLKERLLVTHYREWVKYLLPLDVRSETVTIKGYIGKAELSKVNRTGQLFFINKRPVKSLSLSYALQNAYQGLLPQKHFPVAIIFLEIDPTTVDANIHPTKREVRLQDERMIQEQFIHCLKKTLGKGDHSPKISFSYSLDKGKTYAKRSAPVSFDFKELKEKAGGDSYLETVRETASSHQMVRETQGPMWLEGEKKLKVVPPFGQIKGSYILAEIEEGLMIIDQHAAHERIVFEQILDSLEKGDATAQALLLPVMLELGFKEAQLLEEHLGLLTAMGFGINHLGGNTFSVDATPAWLGNVEVKELLQGFLNEVAEGKGPLNDRRENAAKILACKSRTVKANEKLSPEEMEHLINGLEKTRQPFTCPHGRPTFIKFTMSDLERHFKRR